MGLLSGTTSSFLEGLNVNDEQGGCDEDEWQYDEDAINDEDEHIGPVEGGLSGSLSDIKLTSKCGKHD